jgi:hypothetical protein
VPLLSRTTKAALLISSMSQGRGKRRGVISEGIRRLPTPAPTAAIRKLPVGLSRLRLPLQSRSKHVANAGLRRYCSGRCLSTRSRTSARVESFITVGMVSGRGNGRDQSGRDTAQILRNSTKGLTERYAFTAGSRVPVRHRNAVRVLHDEAGVVGFLRIALIIDCVKTQKYRRKTTRVATTTEARWQRGQERKFTRFWPMTVRFLYWRCSRFDRSASHLAC